MPQERRWLGDPSGGPSRQRGASSIEFVLLFLLFFAVFYALVSYALPMLMLQAFHHAAMAGARAAVKVERQNVTEAAYFGNVTLAVRNTVGERLSWLLPKAKTVVLGTENSNVGVDFVSVKATGEATGVMTVKVTIKVAVKDAIAAHFLMPILNLPGIGPVPKLPANLTAVASLEL